jgi:alkanesulfonate monooxygenase SsuD/methylene tetrahydromethanopterin reductase-like flavin-dependent oxidoreductase (luciferase family)
LEDIIAIGIRIGAYGNVSAMIAPLHLGLTPWLAPLARRADELARQAELAEAWGYESFWLPENHFGEGAIPEPMMLLSAVAGATSAIRLGTTSYLLPLRHPLQAAEQVAVLDQLSNGRVILGVGRGYQPALFDAFNVERSEKREIFADCLATMRRAWRGDAIADANVSVWPRPVQQPHPPIWVAAFGPKALRQAGSLGLPYLASPMESFDVLRENYRRHTDACRQAGVAVPDVVPIMRTVFVADDAATLTRIREALGAQVNAMRATADATMRARMPHSVDEWGIVGTRQQVQAQIEAYRRELGMTHLIATRLRIGGIDGELLQQSMRALADVVGVARNVTMGETA